jgi:hypothetical protein
VFTVATFVFELPQQLLLLVRSYEYPVLYWSEKAICFVPLTGGAQGTGIAETLTNPSQI